MTDTFITLDETEAFLSANPNVTWIDLIVFDINGIPRGKRFRRDDLAGRRQKWRDDALNRVRDGCARQLRRGNRQALGDWRP